MKITKTSLNDLYVLEPKVYDDERGYFFESYNSEKFKKNTGLDLEFVQDNESYSKKGVLRGLHYQVEKPQAKLVRVAQGCVYDVAVDLRQNSTTFGKWFGAILSDENKKQLWIPEGFAHGFIVMSEEARFNYKVTEYWYPEHERCIIFNDPSLAIEWPIGVEPIVSKKDQLGTTFSQSEKFH